MASGQGWLGCACQVRTVALPVIASQQGPASSEPTRTASVVHPPAHTAVHKRSAYKPFIAAIAHMGTSPASHCAASVASSPCSGACLPRLCQQPHCELKLRKIRLQLLLRQKSSTCSKNMTTGSQVIRTQPQRISQQQVLWCACNSVRRITMVRCRRKTRVCSGSNELRRQQPHCAGDASGG